MLVLGRRVDESVVVDSESDRPINVRVHSFQQQLIFEQSTAVLIVTPAPPGGARHVLLLNQTLQLAPDATVQFVGVRKLNGRMLVRLGFVAPPSVVISRAELIQRQAQQQLQAALV